MVKIMKGVLYNKRIELEEETGLPPGTLVTVEIEPQEMSPENRKRLVYETGNSWENDITLGPIFEKIIEERLATKGREVRFSDSA